MQVLLLDVPFDGAMLKVEDNLQSRSKVARALSGAAGFLAQHPTARIVLIIDTHCLEESGQFIWKGNSPESYESCSLAQVCSTFRWNMAPHPTHAQIIETSIPAPIRQFLSNDKNTPVHGHQSLILNLACGASIRLPESRNSLFQG